MKLISIQGMNTFELSYVEMVYTGSLLVSTFGFLGLIWQMKREKDFNHGRFFIELHTYITNNESYKKIFEEMNKIELYKGNPCCSLGNDIEINDIVTYINFFSLMKILVDKRVLEIKDIDSMYSWRFFSFVNNPFVQAKELNKFSNYYYEIYSLYDVWKRYRQLRGLEISGEKCASLGKSRGYAIYLKKFRKSVNFFKYC